MSDNPAHINFDDMLRAIEHLSQEQKNALRQRLDALESATDTMKEVTSQLKPRTPNMHPGSVWMSDDFDDPLPDEFWFGDDE